MPIKCLRTDCEYNKGNYCTLDYIEIDEHGKCMDYAPRGSTSHLYTDKYTTSEYKNRKRDHILEKED